MDTIIINSQSDMIMRVRMLALHRLGKPILSNVKSFRPREKTELINLVKEMMENIPEEKLIRDFNELADEKLFQQTDDYTTYPVYQMAQPNQPPIEEWKVRVDENGSVVGI